MTTSASQHKPVDSLVIRQVTPADLDACYRIELATFPPSEAAPIENIRRRIEWFPQGFLVAEVEGAVVGMLNSGATDNPVLSDKEFKKLIGHDPDGDSLLILAIGVLPEFQRRGIARQMLDAYRDRARSQGKKRILLMCKEHLLDYYTRAGYASMGVSESTYGGAVWYEMEQILSPD